MSRPPGPMRLGLRSLTALSLASATGLVAYFWPFFVSDTSALGGHSYDAPYLFVVLLPLTIAVVLAEISEGGIDAKAVAMLGVLAAVGTALRALSPGTGGFEPTFFLVILAGRVFGPGFGFALGSLVIVASGLATGGVGPWMPFQMLGLAWVGLFAGLLPRISTSTVQTPTAGKGGWAGAGRVQREGWGERWILAGYAVVSSLAFGLLLNLSTWPFAQELPPAMGPAPGEGVAVNVQHYAAFFLATSLGWDVVRAIVNAVLILFVGRALLATLRRAARRAAFDAPVVFD